MKENKINELFGIFPIYKLTSGITNNYIFSLEKQLFKNKITFKKRFKN